MKDIIIVKETHEYKNIEFEIELEYYYSEKINDYYVDIELGNRNLKKLKDKHTEIEKQLSTKM